MLDFEITFWDWLTFFAIGLVGFIFLTIIILVASIPGRIAIARNHPDAEAVKLMGFSGLIVVIPWLKALMWSFNPSNIVDIRRFPKDEQADIKAEISELKKGEDSIFNQNPSSQNEPNNGLR